MESNRFQDLGDEDSVRSLDEEEDQSMEAWLVDDDEDNARAVMQRTGRLSGEVLTGAPPLPPTDHGADVTHHLIIRQCRILSIIN